MINAIERVIRVSQNLGIIGFIPLPDSPLDLFLPLVTLRNAYDNISKD